MSCLCVDDLPLSEQAALMNTLARNFQKRLDALTVSWPSPPAPREAAELSTPCAAKLGGGHFFSSPAEQPAMAQSSCKFVPIRPCGCGRHATIYEDHSECTVTYFAECSKCSLRTRHVLHMGAAAYEWNEGIVDPIQYPKPLWVAA